MRGSYDEKNSRIVLDLTPEEVEAMGSGEGATL